MRFAEFPETHRVEMLDQVPELSTAITRAMALVAAADGWADAEEVEQLLRWIEIFTGTDRPREEALRYIEATVAMPESDWPDLFVEARGLSLANKQTVLKCCLLMAMADGEISEPELDRAARIAHLIELDFEGFEAVVDHCYELVSRAKQ